MAKYKTALLEADYSNVLNYYRYGPRKAYTYETWGTDLPDFYDMQGLLKNVMSAEDFALWQQETAKVITCAHADFWYSGYPGGYRTYPIDAEQCCGVSMFVPLEKYADHPYQFNMTYLDCDWAQAVWID